MDDESEWEALLFSRWPVLAGDVRGPLRAAGSLMPAGRLAKTVVHAIPPLQG